jgi:hypothetical protein
VREFILGDCWGCRGVEEGDAVRERLSCRSKTGSDGGFINEEGGVDGIREIVCFVVGAGNAF